MRPLGDISSSSHIVTIKAAHLICFWPSHWPRFCLGKIIYIFVSVRPDKSVSQCEVNDQTSERFPAQTSASWTLLFPQPAPVWSGLTMTWDFSGFASWRTFAGNLDKSCCREHVCQFMILHPTGKCIISQIFKASHLKLGFIEHNN